MPLPQTLSARRAVKLAACLLAGGAWATASAGQSDGVCARGTKEGTKACTASANAGYALAIGMCANITDRGTKAECIAKAQTVLAKDQKFCAAQTSARSKVCTEMGPGAYDPVINPADFGYPITNQWLPMIPGTTFTYTVPNGLNTVKITRKTQKLLGIDCVVVEDVVVVDGQQEESTLDYFTQDKYGNVWYFGEDTQQKMNGRISGLVGSWRAGVHGAKPGIIMEADPRHEDAYRQEFLLGTAEDSAEVVNFDNKVSVPYGTFHNAMKTLEFSGLEPGSKENKYYVPGIGNVLVVDLVTGERDELVSVVQK
jgi:hypothetical protein